MTSELAKVAQVLALWGVVAMVWLWLVVADQRQDIALSLQRLRDAGEELALANRLETLRGRFTRAQDVPDWVATMIPYITRASQRAGVTVRDLAPRAPEAHGPCKALGMELSLSGSYASVAGFVEELERGQVQTGSPDKAGSGERVVRVSALSLTSRPPGTDTLEGTARVELYTR